MADSNPIGANPRQSRTLQRLSRCVDPAGLTALAAAALVLFDELNAGRLVVNSRTQPQEAKRLKTVLYRVDALQEHINGSSQALPEALADLLEAAECDVRYAKGGAR